MKKWTILCLALCLTLALCASAAADTWYTDIKANDVSLNKWSDTYAVREEGSDYYVLMSADGKLLTTEGYTAMSPSSSYPMYVVSVRGTDGVHDEGVIDANGQVLVPPIYADTSILSDRWITGVVLVPCSADDKDYTFTNYSTDEKYFYRIDHTDIYYRGALVGSLSRSDVDYITPHGDYLSVKNREGTYAYYDRNMVQSPRKGDYSGEYDTEYKSGKTIYWHQGSGQQAFTASCTLTPDEVEKAYIYDRGVVYDLQGNQLFKAKQNYDSIRDEQNGYAIVTMNGLRGMVDKQGNEVIPVEFEDLGYYENEPLKYGVISAVKDGKFGFVTFGGVTTCPFTYNSSVVRNRGTFATIQDMNGDTVVLSGWAGEMPEHYKDVEFSSYDSSAAFVATNAEGQKSIIALNGAVLLPWTDEFRSIYLNEAGTLAVCYSSYRQYRVYRFDAVDYTAMSAGAVEPAPAALPEGHWICTNCGEENDRNFCTNCGAAKPVPACPSCGHVFEGAAPNFCPNCGTKIK